ncbi:gas vesicle protein K [Oscillatoria sp. HE19RPO]|uniref:gas vesicle protein K n=1 Tax=Oscillatoria sp. HE19RPO TaxID=2954806 RepID=UPI0020C4171F|nr:gas vesicle protein K [Oscillatoria sp. HE19RPO]
MALADTPSDPSQISEILPTRRAINSKAGLASLVLTLVELIRQLMEAQVIRRMDEQMLSETELDAAAESLQKLEEEILRLCDIFEINPNDLNLDLGEVGTLLPKPGSYYPGEPSQEASILELLDRLLNVGIVVQGDLDLGVANLNLIQAKLRLVLTSQPL